MLGIQLETCLNAFSPYSPQEAVCFELERPTVHLHFSRPLTDSQANLYCLGIHAYLYLGQLYFSHKIYGQVLQTLLPGLERRHVDTPMRVGEKHQHHFYDILMSFGEHPLQKRHWAARFSENSSSRSPPALAQGAYKWSGMVPDRGCRCVGHHFTRAELATATA